MLSTLRDLHRNEYKDSLEITDEEILYVKIAGLCHDMGHGPFSHLFDLKFIKRVLPNSKWYHEDASCNMFDYMIQENKHLKEMFLERGIGDAECELIKRMIQGRDPNKDRIPERYCFNGEMIEKWYLYEIVSNKRTGIDCDKFDYIARDAHHVGLNNAFNFMRFFQNVRILVVNGQHQICIRDKEMFNTYELFHVRWSLHHQVYQHKTTKVVDEMLTEALCKVDEKFGISSSINDMARYTFMTDSIIYDVLRSKDNDQCVREAQEILNRIQQRQIYRFCGQINPNSTRRDPEKLYLSQPITSDSQVIAEEIAEFGEDLIPSDIYVDLPYMSFGMKNKNPVEQVTFFAKNGQPLEIRSDQLSDMLPKTFQETYIRVFCKKDSQKQITELAFSDWCKGKGFLIPNVLDKGKSGYFTAVKKSDKDINNKRKERQENVSKTSHIKRCLEL